MSTMNLGMINLDISLGPENADTERSQGNLKYSENIPLLMLIYIHDTIICFLVQTAVESACKTLSSVEVPVSNMTRDDFAPVVKFDSIPDFITLTPEQGSNSERSTITTPSFWSSNCSLPSGSINTTDIIESSPSLSSLPPSVKSVSGMFFVFDC